MQEGNVVTIGCSIFANKLKILAIILYLGLFLIN